MNGKIQPNRKKERQSIQGQSIGKMLVFEL